MNLLIIGGDAAGMSAASRARRRCPDMNITVLEQTPDVSYSACGMPYNIADTTRDIEDLVVRRASVFLENTKEAKKAGFSPVDVLIKSSSRAHSYPGGGGIWVYMVGDFVSGRLLGVQMVGPEGVAHRINAPAVALHNQRLSRRYGAG